MGQVLPVAVDQSVPELAVIARVAAGDQRSTTASNNRIIYNTTGLEARTATSQLKSREDAMTDGEQAVALELTSLLEDMATMEQQGLDTKMISPQISHLCQN